MSKFTKEMVDNYADKLLIGLTDLENQMVLDEMDEMDAAIDKALNSIPNLSEVEPMSWALDRVIESLREDIVEDSIPLDDLLQNSGCVSGDAIEVPRVVAE